MTIKEALELKEGLESKIETLIKEFEETTGLAIDDIYLIRSDFSTMDNPNHKPLHYIEVKATL